MAVRDAVPFFPPVYCTLVNYDVCLCPRKINEKVSNQKNIEEKRMRNRNIMLSFHRFREIKHELDCAVLVFMLQ